MKFMFRIVILVCLLGLLAFRGLSASNVQFLLTDPSFGISQTTNIEIILQAETAGGVNSSIQLLPYTLYGWTDTNGQYTFTNIFGSPISGFYHWTVPANSNPQGNGPPFTYTGDIWVQSTNLGTISSTLIGIHPNGSAYPQTQGWSWNAFTSDLRYQLAQSFSTNYFYPLFGNPSNYVQNATLIVASNSIVSLIPSTNGFVGPSITNGLAGPSITNNFATIAYVLGITNGFTGPGITNNFATIPYVQNATNGFVGPGITNGYWTSNQVALAINSATNVNGGFATTNYVNSATNATIGYLLTQISLTNIANLTTTTNQFNTVSNWNAQTSNTLQFAKQPASTILTNLSVTGANTNGYAPGVGIYFTTNGTGTIQTINSSAPGTNGFVGPSITNGFATVPFVQTATNGFVGIGITNGLAGPSITNGFVGASITNNFATIPFVQSATNGFVGSAITNGTWLQLSNDYAIITNALALTNSALVAYINQVNSNSFVTLSNLTIASTNAGNILFTNNPIWVALTTNGFNFVNTTSGVAYNLNLQNVLSLGTKTNWISSTNDFGLNGPVGSPFVEGTYWGVPYGSVWTNFAYPSQTIVLSGGSFFAQSNTTTLYSSSDGRTWTTVPPGIAPPPGGNFGYDDLENGVNHKGWFLSTNLTAQIANAIFNATNGFTGGGTNIGTTNFLVSGVVQGPTTNIIFSATGTNVMVNLIAQYGVNPTNGISAATATNIALSMAGYATNGLGGMAFQPTNPWTTYNLFTNVSVNISNTIANLPGGGGSSNAIALLNGLGTNTSLTNFLYLSGTNIYAQGIQSSNIWGTNIYAVNVTATNIVGTNSGSVFAWASNSTATNFYSRSILSQNATFGTATVTNTLTLFGSGIQFFLQMVNGNFEINTNVITSNVIEANGNIDASSISTAFMNNTTNNAVTINTTNLNATNVNVDTVLADSISANSVNASQYSVSGIPVFFPSNAPSQFTFFVTNAFATNQFQNPNNFNGIYVYVNNFGITGLYSNLNGSGTNYLLLTTSGTNNLNLLLNRTNNSFDNKPTYSRFGSPVGQYSPSTYATETPIAYPIVSIYAYSNNVSALPYLAQGPGGNYDGFSVTNIQASNIVGAVLVLSNSVVQYTNGSAIGTIIYDNTGLTNYTTFGPNLIWHTNIVSGKSLTLSDGGINFYTAGLTNRSGYTIQSNAAVVYSGTNVYTFYTNGVTTLNGFTIITTKGSMMNGVPQGDGSGTNYVWINAPLFAAATISGFLQAGAIGGVASNATALWISNLVTNGQPAAVAGNVVTMRTDGTLWLTNATGGGGITGLTNGQPGNVIVATNGTLGYSNGVAGGFVSVAGTLSQGSQFSVLGSSASLPNDVIFPSAGGSSVHINGQFGAAGNLAFLVNGSSVIGTLESGSFGSYGTYTNGVTSGGYTNLNAFDVLAIGFIGTSVVESNSTAPAWIYSRGTITVPTDIVLRPNYSLTGTLCSGKIVQ